MATNRAQPSAGTLPVHWRTLPNDELPQAQVAFLHDYASRWSLDLQPHNRDLQDDEAYRRALMGPYEALWSRNVPAVLLSAKGSDDLSAYKLVILPALNLVGPSLAGRLAAYVRGGGTLIVTARSGFKDEWGQVPAAPPGHLAALVGATVSEFDSRPPQHTNRVRFVEGAEGSATASLWFEVLALEEARPLALYEEDAYAGQPAAAVRELGQGRVIYVGLLAGPDFYDLLFDWLLAEIGVAATLATPPGVEAVERVGPRGRLLFVLNHNDAAAEVALSEPYADALTGEAVGALLSLAPRQVRILLSAGAL